MVQIIDLSRFPIGDTLGQKEDPRFESLLPAGRFGYVRLVTVAEQQARGIRDVKGDIYVLHSTAGVEKHWEKSWFEMQVALFELGMTEISLQ